MVGLHSLLGNYYGKKYPRNGMKMARELGTMTYRSGPEWNERFARKRIDSSEDPMLCPTFLIESYLDYQGMLCGVDGRRWPVLESLSELCSFH